ncbi:hypothetical protein A3K86_13220 [Photobacterium jeanii]|uniref:Glycosyltransferase 2-like domain-containing protein n=1 Tax=Photobacterium jeanii TaxID=858640 RepID=A0A178KA73_9GAMM|nr:glycosyltransferase [Photobacterium jeanii]OAN13543.1 hypothetical protein A3K86_13220 [Photobacterium jeanii]PST88658.1 hypothetical protein C9I91_15070 [Photobacterium jeanii]
MNILPIVVLYKTKVIESQAVEFLVGNSFFREVFVYDNTPDLNAALSNSKLHDKVNYYHDPSNPGVSKAYNVAAKYAIENNYDWLLILDQDTKLDDKLISAYQRAHIRNPDIKIFAPQLKTAKGAPCSPCRIVFKRGLPVRNLLSRRLSLAKYAPINSGILVDLQTFDSVSGYNEKVFLDFSDFQFIERLSQKVDEFYVVNHILEQDFSNDSSDTEILKQRFKLYCQCARLCEKKSLKEYFEYGVTTLLRCLSLMYRTRNTSFVKILLSEFWSLK